MTNDELIARLPHVTKYPESVSLEQLVYLVSLLQGGIIEAYWDDKVSYDVMTKICLDEDKDE